MTDDNEKLPDDRVGELETPEVTEEAADAVRGGMPADDGGEVAMRRAAALKNGLA